MSEADSVRAAPQEGPSPKVQLIETLVFLFLITPSLALSFFANASSKVGFVLVAVATILRDLGLVGLILYFLWRNGEPLRKIGWIRPVAAREALLGALLFVPVFLAVTSLEFTLRAAGLSAPSTPLPSFLTATGTTQLLLAGLLVVVVAIAEESIFRGYLILRLKPITGGAGRAVLVSALIFSLGHGYEGAVGVISVALMGLLLGWIYLWRGNLVAVTVIHFLQDFIGIVVLPYFGVH
ncbi:MAG: type II CAAX endopeptidase family protein [Gammaproteobacteria bacterium]|jgi:membrane protease YdiL (CAAX protease family)